MDNMQITLKEQSVLINGIYYLFQESVVLPESILFRL